jgi:acylphosphatase
MTKAIVAVVRGGVQGVGFRYYARSMANRLGVRGYVQNQRDGSVKVVCEGDTAAVDQFSAWLRSGPPSARVTDISIQTVRPTGGYLSFEVEF